MVDQKKQVTPQTTIAAGAAALTIGGLAGGLSHYHGTRKQLIEEGIDPRARLRALPIAVRRPNVVHGAAACCWELEQRCELLAVT